MPLAIDLYCGLGGWTDGLLAEGYDVIGFDNERHEYGDHRYPAHLVLQDVRTLHGRQFKDAALIVASPPCVEYSYMAMPWKRGKRIAQALRGHGDSNPLVMDDGSIIEFDEDGFPVGYTGSRTIDELNLLFDACFRIQREAIEAAGRHIPLVVENVVGAQAWVGQAATHFGSYYLWGDVPQYWRGKAIKHGGGDLFGDPQFDARKNPGFRFDGSGKSFQTESVKNAGQDWSRHAKTGEVSPHWNISATKNSGGSWFRVAHNTTSGKGQNPDGRNDPRDNPPHTPHMTNPEEHTKLGGSWFHGYRKGQGPRNHGSKSPKRKASALIAKIPFELARHIAAVYRESP